MNTYTYKPQYLRPFLVFLFCINIDAIIQLFPQFNHPWPVLLDSISTFLPVCIGYYIGFYVLRNYRLEKTVSLTGDTIAYFNWKQDRLLHVPVADIDFSRSHYSKMTAIRLVLHSGERHKIPMETFSFSAWQIADFLARVSEHARTVRPAGDPALPENPAATIRYRYFPDVLMSAVAMTVIGGLIVINLYTDRNRLSTAFDTASLPTDYRLAVYYTTSMWTALSGVDVFENLKKSNDALLPESVWDEPQGVIPPMLRTRFLERFPAELDHGDTTIGAFYAAATQYLEANPKYKIRKVTDPYTEYCLKPL